MLSSSLQMASFVAPSCCARLSRPLLAVEMAWVLCPRRSSTACSCSDCASALPAPSRNFSANPRRLDSAAAIRAASCSCQGPSSSRNLSSDGRRPASSRHSRPAACTCSSSLPMLLALDSARVRSLPNCSACADRARTEAVASSSSAPMRGARDSSLCAVASPSCLAAATRSKSFLTLSSAFFTCVPCTRTTPWVSSIIASRVRYLSSLRAWLCSDSFLCFPKSAVSLARACFTPLFNCLASWTPRTRSN
mmetsp:Transcript_75020/g.223596  ORF Transcript_75020/g.223596 Transcript_75020/m.223596 type:complete len:250 (-) Transcript_75020:610-1359(-)